jgi:hypothetical protein
MNNLMRPAAVLLGAGVLLAVAYELLSAFGVGKIGEPTDIGGGFIFLAGIGLAAVGAVLLVVALLQRRSARR